MIWRSRFHGLIRFTVGWALVGVVVLMARLMAGQ
jgi:hypothetical protein